MAYIIYTANLYNIGHGEASADPLIAMKIVGHTDYKTTANIYTHVQGEMLKNETVNIREAFGSRWK